MDIVWCRMYRLNKRTLSAIMCMHDIIVVDNYVTVEHKDRQSRPGHDAAVTCIVCVYCSLFSVCLITRSISLVLLCMVLLGRCSAV